MKLTSDHRAQFLRHSRSQSGWPALTSHELGYELSVNLVWKGIASDVIESSFYVGSLRQDSDLDINVPEGSFLKLA
jgi:hypothetical protein